MFRLSIAIACTLAILPGQGMPNGVITSAAHLDTVLKAESGIDRTFHLTAKVISPYTKKDHCLVVEDKSGAVILNCDTPGGLPVICSGDTIDISGTIRLGPIGSSYADCTIPTVLNHGQPYEPTPVTLSELKKSAAHDNRLIKATGIIRDVIADEIDDKYLFIVICSAGESAYVAVKKSEMGDFRPEIGATISICGIWGVSTFGTRRQLGKMLSAQELTLDLPSADNPFNAPPVRPFRELSPSEISSLGRHSTSGLVVAVWHDNTILLKTDSARFAKIELSNNTCPTPGDCIQAVGFPESDLYNVNLTRAIWKRIPDLPITEEPPVDASAEVLMDCCGETPIFNPQIHGQLVTATGIVRTGPQTNGRFSIECATCTIPIDASMTPSILDNLTIGCKVKVTGICIAQLDNWRPNASFPQIRGFTVVVRNASDVKVLATPPWWTFQRLMTTIGSLIAILIALVVWNVSLRNVADRRSRALLKEQMARVESELKVGERTRLSVELHDTLSQNLLGASMEINTVEQMTTDEDMLKHLHLASRTIKASQDELRNCLWDLRSAALDEPDMNAAIRKTLEPYVSDVDLQVRFNVPREIFTDSTAHVLMRIIRELVLNAIRHGHATVVKVAGSRADEELLFSVRDNGGGFDPAAAPGIGQGHFGLQGVRERLRLLNGFITIKSASGEGTYVSVSFHLPEGNKEKI